MTTTTHIEMTAAGDEYDVIVALSNAIINVGQAVEDWPDDQVSLAILYGVIQSQRQQLGAVLTSAEQRLLSTTIPREGLIVPGVGSFVRRGGTVRKKWDGKRIASILAARVADTATDRETGEMKPPAVLCQDVADELAKCGGLDNGSHQWRASELRRRGLDPDTYAETETGRSSVQFMAVEE